MGNPTNAERIAIGVATTTVGALTERERKICIEVSRLFSGYVADMEDQIQGLNGLVLELRRLNTEATDGGE